MPRKTEPKARLGWYYPDADTFTYAMGDGPNRQAAEQTLVHLLAAGTAAEVVDIARTTAFLMLAEAVDHDPTNAALWGQYRAAEEALRGAADDGKPDPLETFLSGLSAEVPDAAQPEPGDARAPRRQDGRGGGAATDAVAAPRRGRRPRAEG